MNDRIECTVTGDERIRCSGCETDFVSPLSDSPAWGASRADGAMQHVSVTFDPARVSRDQVRKRLKELRFDVEVLS
ncbi:hypothetical protein KEX41_29295 (plasmid) [Burkholderia thailandensis]|uniref:hypothetical protein n=1 Tax=Burkholderia thailandensis TaxID=57975 RepID=UPI00192E199D|nr:hypothetical protein [Burkholderia thailandensis]MBS2132280.1 hypothetical protein [Burkholderia thailandensis]QRA15369.1 hypothetical protein JMY07_29720 [Burkholderia thailandensis]